MPSAPSADVVWKGHCRDPKVRYRLLGHLDRLAQLSAGYGRQDTGPQLSLVGAANDAPPRSPIEVIDETVSGPILISSAIALHPDRLVERAHEAGLALIEREGETAPVIQLDEARLRGLDFSLFDPRKLYPHDDRMSFVFLECPHHHFLDGRLVQVTKKDGAHHLKAPSLRLAADLQDWTDCLFSWTRFFLVGDFWWQRREELQGYRDYRGVFEELQTARGPEDAENAAFEAVLSTFSQHAEHGIAEADRPARAGKV